MPAPAPAPAAVPPPAPAPEAEDRSHPSDVPRSKQHARRVSALKAELAELEGEDALATRFLYVGLAHTALRKTARKWHAALTLLTANGSSPRSVIARELDASDLTREIKSGSTSNLKTRLSSYLSHSPSFRFLAVWRSTAPMLRADVEDIEHAIQKRVARLPAAEEISAEWITGVTVTDVIASMEATLDRKHSGKFEREMSEGKNSNKARTGQRRNPTPETLPPYAPHLSQSTRK